VCVCVCVFKDGSTPLLIVADCRFGAGIFGNHRGPTLHATMQPLEEARPRSPPQGCDRTLVGPPRDRLHVVGSWVGLGPSHIGARPRFFVGVGLCLVL
jgi:hypothetical protein